MPELKEMHSTLAAAAVSTALLSFSLWILSQRRKISSSSQVAKRFAVTENNAWLDQASYDVVTAFCDAFIPSLETSDLTLDKVNAAVDAINPDLRKHCIKIDQNTIRKHRDYLLRGALDINLHWVVADAIGKLVTKEERFQVALMLKVLSTSAGCYMITGYPVAFQDLPLLYRVKAMEALRDCSLAPLRVFYQTFKRVAGNLFYSYISEHGAANPNWKELNYHPEETVGKGKVRTAEEEHKAREIDRQLRDKVSYPSVYNNLTAGKFVSVPSSADADTTDVLECDVVVVGSGSGGGMMAAQLAKAGFNVLVLEKGGYFRAEEFKSWRESEAFLHAFEKGGLCSTVEGNVLVLAGSCVGGGSTINWSASLRTPSVVQEDWALQGMTQFRQGGEFDQALDAVHGLLSVNCDNTHRTPAEQAALRQINTNDHCEGGGCNDNGDSTVCENNQNNANLWEGAERLGFVPEKIPRNAINCVDCGHCCHGCPYESKQSTQTALFEPLLLDPRYQIEVIPHCTVKKVLYENSSGTAVACADGMLHPSYKRAIGVEAEVRVYDKNLADLSVADRLKAMEHFSGRTRRVLVKAKVVVSAAGSLHTPALLLRSNITHKGMVGQHLTLHPVLGCGGVFLDQETRLASGVSMGVVIRQPSITADFDFSKPASSRLANSSIPAPVPTGNARYTAVLQTPPAHVGLMGLLLPWNGSGLTTKLSMLNWRHSSTFLALVRDQSQARNRVTIDWQGNPVLHYDITAQDKALMLAGLEANLRLMRAAGAKMIYFGHENFPWFFCGKGASSGASNTNNNDSVARTNCTSPTNVTRTPFTSTDDERFEDYIRSMRKEGIQTARMNVFSAHQMSSCRMAPSPLLGPTSPSGELYEVTNLFVADGSVLPTSLGVNPMVTIEAMAYMIAQNVNKRLCEDKAIATRVRKFQEQKKW